MTLIKSKQKRLEILQEYWSTGDISEVILKHDIGRSTLFDWQKRYHMDSKNGLIPNTTKPKTSPKNISPEAKKLICHYAKMDKFISAKAIWRQIKQDGYKISYDSVLRTLKKQNPPLFGHIRKVKVIKGRPDYHYKTGLVTNRYQLDPRYHSNHRNTP